MGILLSGMKLRIAGFSSSVIILYQGNIVANSDFHSVILNVKSL